MNVLNVILKAINTNDFLLLTFAFALLGNGTSVRGHYFLNCLIAMRTGRYITIFNGMLYPKGCRGLEWTWIWNNPQGVEPLTSQSNT